jgi:hypothetical protein
LKARKAPKAYFTVAGAVHSLFVDQHRGRIVLTQSQFQHLADLLKGICNFNAESQSFSYRGKQFSLHFHEVDRRSWVELCLDQHALKEDNAVESLATALASNSAVLNALPVPTYFGLKDSPARLVILFRLEGQAPTPQELLRLLDELPNV